LNVFVEDRNCDQEEYVKGLHHWSHLPLSCASLARDDLQGCIIPQFVVKLLYRAEFPAKTPHNMATETPNGTATTQENDAMQSLWANKYRGVYKANLLFELNSS
jgi:hypothetical protein